MNTDLTVLKIRCIDGGPTNADVVLLHHFYSLSWPSKSIKITSITTIRSHFDSVCLMEVRGEITVKISHHTASTQTPFKILSFRLPHRVLLGLTGGGKNEASTR